MTSIFLALSKQYIRRGWLVCAAFVAASVLGPLALATLMALDGLRLDREEFDPNQFYISFIGMLLFGCGLMATVPHEGMGRLLRRLPVRSHTAVAWLISSTSLAVIITSLAIHTSYQWLFQTDWPVLGPTLFATVFVLVSMSLYWELHRLSFRKVAVCLLVISGMLAWFVARNYPGGIDTNLQPWPRVTAADAASLVGALLVAGLVLLRAFQRYRIGDVGKSERIEQFERWVKRIGHGAAAQSEPAPPAETLRQFAWKDYGRGYTAAISATVGVMVFLILLAATKDRNPSAPLYIVFPALGGIALGGCLGAGVFRDPKSSMQHLIACCPLSDSDLAAVFTGLARRSILIVWVAATLGGIAPFLWWPDQLGLRAATNPLGVLTYWDRWPWLQTVVLMSLMLGTLWTSASLSMSLVWIGNARITKAISASLFLSILAVIIALRFLVPSTWVEPVSLTVLAAAALATLGGTLAAFQAAWRRRLIGVRQLVLASAIWLIAIGLTWPAVSDSGAFQIPCSGLLLLTILPIATAPLAISYGRHGSGSFPRSAVISSQ